MLTIWKYPIIFTPDMDRVGLEMPVGAKILFTDKDPASGFPAFWAEVDPTRLKALRRFQVVGTGHPLPELGNYIGSALCTARYDGTPAGTFVWHIFEV